VKKDTAMMLTVWKTDDEDSSDLLNASNSERNDYHNI
jgi:hypothetical protein